MARFRLVETHNGTLTRRWEVCEAELRRDRPELAGFLDEGLASLHVTTRRRELRLLCVETQEDRLRWALAEAGFALPDGEVARLADEVRRLTAEGSAADIN